MRSPEMVMVWPSTVMSTSPERTPGSDRLNTNSWGSSNTSRSGRQSTSGPLRSSSKYARRSGDRPHTSIPTFNGAPHSNGAPNGETLPHETLPREVGGVPGEAGGGGPLTLPREVGGVPGEAGGGGRATAPQGRGLVVIRPEA